MKLITEDLPAIEGATRADVDRALRADGFGKFVILSATEDEARQAPSAWEPTPEGSEFLRLHDSDPWALEHIHTSEVFRAVGLLTLDQVRVALRADLDEDDSWQRAFVWVKS